MRGPVWWWVWLALGCARGQQWGAVLPSCGTGVCTTSLDLAITLSADWQAYAGVITAVTTTTGTVRLVNPLSVRLQRLASVARVRVAMLRELYNAYERYDFDPTCEAAYYVGGCASDAAARPPPAWAGAERYVLCCDGRSPRGWGQHCLRWNTSLHYRAYALQQPEVEQVVTVAVATAAGGTVFAANLTSLWARVAEGTGGAVRLDNLFTAPHFGLKNNLAAQVLLVNFSAGALPDDTAQWLLAGDVDRLSLDAFQWKAEATCAQPAHYNTATHADPAHLTDQFYAYREARLLTYVQQQLLNATDAPLRGYPIRLRFDDDGRQSGVLEFTPYLNPDQSELYLSVYNVTVSS